MELDEIFPKPIATMGRSKLRENVSLCPPPVPPSTHGNKGIGEVPRGNTNCAPPYIVSGLSASPPPGAIPFDKVENVILAVAFSTSLGFPPEYHLTVRWDKNGEDGHEYLLRKIAEWQRYHIGISVFVWARETNSRSHSHILFHTPRHLVGSFRKLARRWVKEVHGVRRLPRGTLRIRRIWSHG